MSLHNVGKGKHMGFLSCQLPYFGLAMHIDYENAISLALDHNANYKMVLSGYNNNTMEGWLVGVDDVVVNSFLSFVAVSLTLPIGDGELLGEGPPCVEIMRERAHNEVEVGGQLIAELAFEEGRTLKV